MAENAANFVPTQKGKKSHKKLSLAKLKISCESAGSKAVVKISGRISQWNNHADGFRAAVDSAIANGSTDVDVQINSQGGEVFEANEIGNEIQRFTGTKTALLGAMCASAATYISSICDKVVAKKNTQYMIHKPYGGVSGNKDEIASQLVLLENLTALYAKTYAAKTGLPLATIEQMWAQDCWMNADQAKAKKFIDEVEGETAEVTSEDIAAINACNYKNTPAFEATTHETLTIQSKIMKDKLILMLAGLAGFNLTTTSGDSELLAFVETLKAKAIKVDQIQAAHDDLKAKYDATVKAAKATEIKALLDGYESNKQILATEREYFAEQLADESKFAKTKAHLDAKPKIVAISGQLPAAGSATGKQEGADTSKWTYADWQEKDPKGLAAMADSDEDKFNSLFTAHYGK